ncbi:MAG TPA: menaquinone biosynthesis decarboxylase [Armatimonadota bacterium]|nr:menaquinone biosynthesis decarboxylase [Armatimonadota bacterium]
MSYFDLGQFVDALRAAGELKEIDREVDPFLEISEIADRVVKSGGPALLFSNVRGAKIPLLINAFGSMRRMSMALGVESLDQLGEELDAILQPKMPAGLQEAMGRVSQAFRLSNARTRIVSEAPCQELVETTNPSLDDLPIITCWPEDAGPYITLGQVITRNPADGSRNVGMYRLQKYDAQTLGLHWQRHKTGARHYEEAEKRGARLEVAVALGPDPAIIYASTAPLPEGIDEFMFAGYLRSRPVELVKCRTVSLEVPASSQIVLEGYCEPGERCLEGPFGDHTGFYSLADDYPVFHLTAVTRRRAPIYPTIIVGRPPMEDGYLGKATERLFLPLLRKVLPEIVDMNLPIEGIFHNLCIVSIDKKYPGHARKVMYGIWGTGQMMFTKMIIVLDKDANVQDMREVIWRLGNNMDPRRDVVITDGPSDVLDHAAHLPAYSGKLGIDATVKWRDEGFLGEWPAEIRMSDEVRQRVDSYWKDLNL